MDSLTHLASGALIGELMLGKRLGRRAMLIGAVAQSLPDIDVVASLWLDPTDDLLAHRGITHSLLAVAVTSVILGMIGHRTHKGHPVTAVQWILFIAAEMSTHLFLDAFNNYGTGWFEPFSSVRITFNTLFVADPFYSLPLMIVLIIMLTLSKSHPNRTRWAATGLIISSLYLVYALTHKLEISSSVKQELARQHIPYKRFFTTPTAFNNWLWYVVAEDTAGFRVGYRSVFDSNDTIRFRYFPRQESMAGNSANVQKLIRFSQGYYTIENKNDTLVFNDLRFGQIAAGTNPAAPFVFHYYISHPEANLLVVQRGRFSGWDRKTVGEFVKRIKGD